VAGISLIGKVELMVGFSIIASQSSIARLKRREIYSFTVCTAYST